MTLTPRSRPAHSSPPVASLLATVGLVGGFAIGQATGRRDLAAVVFGLAGALAARDWARTSGGRAAALLTAGYVGGMGASHPLAHRTGPWPAVGIVTAAVVTASEVVGRR